jgi:hypothetical protein
MIGNPGDDLVRRDCTHGHQEHGEGTWACCCSGGGDDIANAGYSHQTYDMNGSVTSATCGHSDDQRYKERCEPDGDRKKKRLDVSVAESVDDRGQEVLEGLRQKGCMLEQDEEIDAIISDSQFQSGKEGHAGSAISLHGIVDETQFCERPLFIGKPFGTRGEVWQDESVTVS